MIDQRPASAETKLEAGHWEGDLILGVGSASAMVTLRERRTQYGVIVNLPHDHTAASVNAAVTGAFTAMPAHMKRTLTWDQGVEMGQAPRPDRRDRCPDLLRRTLQPVATRRERELQRPPPPVLPQGQQPRQPLPGSRQPCHARTQRTPPERPRLRHPGSPFREETSLPASPLR